MSFVQGKIALVTGGASGIGYEICQHLLQEGCRGLCLADINDKLGKESTEELAKKFGPNRIIFVLTDVSNRESFENTFRKTVENFGNLDIVVNNAGIFNDEEWEKCIGVNLTGVITGTILAIENYIANHRTSTEGVILNIASVAGLFPCAGIPVYTATKWGVVGLSRSLGDKKIYEKKSIRVLTLCPSVTKTNLGNNSTSYISQEYRPLFLELTANLTVQMPSAVGKAATEIINNAKSGTVWVVKDGNLTEAANVTTV